MLWHKVLSRTDVEGVSVVKKKERAEEHPVTLPFRTTASLLPVTDCFPPAAQHEVCYFLQPVLMHCTYSRDERE